MPRKKSLRKKKKNGKILILFLLIFLLGATILFLNTKSTSKISSNTERHNLQLDTFYPSPTKKPSTKNELCSHDTGIPINTGEDVGDQDGCFCEAILIVCKEGRCVDVIEERSGTQFPKGYNYCDLANLHTICSQGVYAQPNGTFCVGKPVIYLYPTKPTLVDVSIKTEGDIFVSDPLYPDGGWKNVLAEPGGKLTYQGKTYKELFYETNVEDIKKPNSGLTLDTTRLRGELDTVISRLGLVGEEKTEFLDYWVPRLKALNSKYIFFSIVEEEEKKRIDHVSYSPEPDTRIEFIAYFAPLDRPYDGPLLELTSTPQRIGFTAVEWGGVIGK